MKAITRISLMAVCALSFSLLLSGCTKDGKKDSKTSLETGESSIRGKDDNQSFVLGKTPLTISFYGNYDWFTMNPWGEDPATKWIKENKKVTVEAIPSGGAAEQKFNAMIASDELPDLIFLERGADVERLQKAGKLVPLDDYFEKYPNLKKWADPTAIKMLRSKDGKLYQFPNWYTKNRQGNGGYMINKKIYKELGSPKLETFDDLYAYLKQVKARYPDVVPFETTIGGQGVDVLYSGFADDHPVLFISQKGIPEGKELTSIFTDPVYRETMQFASKLYREKLMTQDALTQTLYQVRVKMAAGRVAVAAAFNVMDLGRRGTIALREKDKDAGYELIWPLRKAGVDKNKVWPTQYDVLGWNVNVITTNAKNPEAVYAYLDWLTGEEGQRIITWGPEGMYWQGTDDKGTPIFTKKFFEEENEYNRLYGIWDTFTWAGNSSFLAGIQDRVAQQTSPEKRVNQPDYNIETAFNATEFVNLDPQPESEEGIIAQTVNDIYNDTRAKILFAKSDEEVAGLLDKAEREANKAGYDRLLKYKTMRWQENLMKINGK
jgi:putative aldouronate transport system substrate-binding protein